MSVKPTCPKCKRPLRRNGTSSGKQRWRCDGGVPNGSCYSTRTPESKKAIGHNKKTKDAKPVTFKQNLRGKKKLVITSAQNATPVHKGFLAALKQYCKYNNAELVVIPLRYRNPTSQWTASQEGEEWWDPAVAPYLCNQRKKLCENLVLLGDIKVRPTAVTPLSGFEGLTKGESGILGHSKLQLRCIPTPSHQLPKIMTTTGSVTVRNYTDSKDGKKGEFHHCYGACVVEIEGKTFHMRQINACEDGTFMEMTHEYQGGSVPRRMKNGVLAISFGDLHKRFMDPLVEKATFGRYGIVDTLNPEYLIFHDLLDGYSFNPHHRRQKDPFLEFAKRQDDLHLVADEVEDTVAWLDAVTGRRKSVIVSSNHDDFLRRWLVDVDWRRDPDNALFYLETAQAVLKGSKMEKNGAQSPDPFAYWVERLSTKNIRCLYMDESFELAGVECGFHGHRGPNGARGTIKNLSTIGSKLITGHGHSPGIEGGHYRNGTSTYLKLDYTEGPSSWLNSHTVLYRNGKRSLINIIDGEWRVK